MSVRNTNDIRQKGKTMSRYIDADALKAKKTYSHERHEYEVFDE